MKKIKMIVLILVSLTQMVHSQPAVYQMGNILYESNDTLSHEAARLCFAVFGKERVSVMLDLKKSSGKAVYYLSYDNVHGTSIFNDIYRPHIWDYKLLGIRVEGKGNITMYGILKAVKRGIKKKRRLKRIRKRIMRRDPEFRLNMQHDFKIKIR